MLARTLASILLASLASGVAAAQTFSYAPGTTSYRMVVKSSGTSETRGLSRAISLDAQQRLTLTIVRRAPDTLALAIVLDSATITAPELGIRDVRGGFDMTVTALLAPYGRLYTRALPDLAGREALAAVAEEMARFLPIIPAAPRLGLAWSDTTRDSVPQLGLSIARTRITEYAVIADTTIGGERAWRVDRRARTSMEGSASMGTPIAFQGQSLGTGAYFVGHSGRYLGATLHEQVTSRATLTALNQDVVGSQTQTTTITLLK
jgi:hypothetical protein